MPEIPLCIYCQRIVLDHLDFVIVNRYVVDPAAWQYAHAECHAGLHRVASEEPEDCAVAA